MKIKQHSRHVRDKVVEKFKAGLACKSIASALDMPKNTVQSIVNKWKQYGTTANLPCHRRPAKKTIQPRRALFGEVLKRPVVILEKLPRSTAQQEMDGVGWSTSKSQEAFRTDTLSRLASFIARTDTKQPQSHHPHLPLYGCQECKKGFPYAKDLLPHQELKNALPKPHRCPLCGQQFSLRSSLQLHQCDLDSHQRDGGHGSTRRGAPCTTPLSNAGRAPEKSLQRPPHLLDSSPYACAPCGRSFSQKQALLHHQQASCSGSPSNVADARSLPDESPPVSEGDSAHSDFSDTPGPSGGTISMCHICSRIFCTEAALLQHFQDNHLQEELNAKAQRDAEGERTVEVNGGPSQSLKSKKKFLSCRSCDMVFRCTSKLYMHRKEKHRRENSARREPRPAIKKLRKVCTYSCQICSKVFFHHLSLRAHCKRHAEEGRAPAEDKDVSASSTIKDSQPVKVNPNVAKIRRPGIKTRKPGPGRPKKTDSALIRPDREQQAEEESDFPCPSCAQVFSVQQQLKEHMELHQSSVRRRHCSVCSSEMDACKGPGSKRQRLYHCVPCQQGFSALDSFLEHCQEHLRIRVEEDRMSEGPPLQASTA
ncbi:zinc finger protein 629 isoform X1 [Fundulus heteroclitus]|uniref:zinc finger protein 629 isoform X1 n=2 Tax=Fundulus heteroclitus TaxID=8078 RepID=UPI00165B0651|nr:zinc finger protein 629 isoform X1 [Fundulus heteroclitus]XP_036001309.1 zinc finger protein 629 isoform X1 [Fundulus heteroclitus]XP_036001341.1 zinc finger protein 629 isoform X1 [Fundulus heteroclitus]